MRLFIAINFDSNTKQKFINIQSGLKKYATSGNFSREENLHLTLVFLGEIPSYKVEELEKTMDTIDFLKFDICFKEIGVFKHFDSQIWWIGAKHNDTLFNIQKKLCEKLTDDGFVIEKRKYNPHITLVRQAILKEGFDKTKLEEEVLVNVNKISLMESERINGKLVYTEIHSRELYRF